MRLELHLFNLPLFTCIFQFHKGAIRTINSLVVKDYPIKFQFHKGAIRTLGSPDDLRRDVLFQFHKGAIRT